MKEIGGNDSLSIELRCDKILEDRLLHELNGLEIIISFCTEYYVSVRLIYIRYIRCIFVFDRYNVEQITCQYTTIRDYSIVLL